MEISPRSRFIGATRFPFRKWPAGRWAIRLTNKTSELVSLSQ